MRDTLFKTNVEMPPSTDPDVVRSAMTRTDVLTQNYVPATLPTNRDVKNLDRPRRGHGY